MQQHLNTASVLVTGGAGFIGERVIAALRKEGARRIRCMVRPSSKLERLERTLATGDSTSNVELLKGDLLSREDCQAAVKGIDIIYHLAAGVEKSFAGSFMNSALATRNLIAALLEENPSARFVNVSSFSVYSNFNLRHGSTFNEDCKLETEINERHDAYGFGKLKQEQIVREYAGTHGLRYVNIRPGSVFGPGKPALTGRIAISTFGPLLHMGGSNRIPLTYVDNCADAIVLAGTTPEIEGQSFNIVDDDLPTSRQFLRRYKRAKNLKLSVPIPYCFAYLFSSLFERYSRWSKGQLPPVFNRRRCSAEWKAHKYENRRAKDLLKWTPKVPMQEAMRRYIAQFGTEVRGT